MSANSATMKMPSIVRVLVLAVLLSGVANRAVGQARGYRGPSQTPSQVPRYTPQSPTVSPYLNLLNRNASPAGNYYGLVRPLERQQAFNASQAQQAVTQEQQISKIQTQQQENFEQPKVKPTGTAGWFQTYGPSSPYQVESHYYGQWQPPRSPRRTVSGRHF